MKIFLTSLSETSEVCLLFHPPTNNCPSHLRLLCQSYLGHKAFKSSDISLLGSNSLNVYYFLCHAITLSWNIWPQIMLIFSIDSVSFVSFVSGCVLILTLILGHWYWGHWWRLILTWSRHTAGAREGYIQPTKGKQQPGWSQNIYKKQRSFLKIISTFENTKTNKMFVFSGLILNIEGRFCANKEIKSNGSTAILQ